MHFAVSDPETFHTRSLFYSSDPMNPATHMHSNEDPDYNPELEAVSDPGSVPAVGPAHGLRFVAAILLQTVTKAGMVDPDNVPPEAYDARLDRVPVAEVRERRAARAELARALVALRAAKVRLWGGPGPRCRLGRCLSTAGVRRHGAVPARATVGAGVVV